MSADFSICTCPSCQGFGVMTQDKGLITCQTCNGSGIWLQSNQGQKLLLTLPSLLSLHDHQKIKQKTWIKYALAGTSFAAFGIGAFGSLAHDLPSLSRLLWAREPLHALAGLGGLASMWGLVTLQHHQTSQDSLHDLATDLEALKPLESLPLEKYANPRLSSLCHEAALVAHELHVSSIDENILLIALLRQPRIAMMIARLELSADQLIEKITPLIRVEKEGNVGSFSLTPDARLRFYQAASQAISYDFSYIDLEDMLLSFAETPGDKESLFKDFGLTYDAVYRITRWYAEDQETARQWAFWLERGRLRPKGYMNRAWTALPTPFLEQFSTDITRKAANGAVVTVTVRTKEVDTALQILGRTQKNSLLLVGEPGVGKNSVLEAIALRMIEENVPEVLKDKRLVSIDLSALLSGDNPEANLQKVIDEIAQAGNVILAVPEIQVLAGTSQGALDAASVLAGALSRGYLQLISTASYADYHHYVESSSLLSSLLEVVEIKELNTEQAIEVLEQETPAIEARQKVHLTYPALDTAVRLAQRYLPSQVLPASAISLLDEAASAAALANRHWVTSQDVEAAIERKVEVPVSKANAEEANRLLNLEQTLHTRVVGQDQAVQAVASALRRARAGLHVDKRPISSFLFVGPTGVGKTETAKAVADIYFGNEQSMIRLDMSEYQDGQAVYKLIGNPSASSEKYTEGGMLTTAIREHPFSLVLLDEIEKANPDVLNLFLQLLDDGRLTESNGRTVHFNNSIIVATSNAGSEKIVELLREGMTQEQLSEQVLGLLRQHFRPEFINRFDAVIPFHPLRPEDIFQITKLLLAGVQQSAKAQGYTLEFTDEAITQLSKQGFDQVYGARPLRRLIQDKVEGLLANQILAGTLAPGSTLRISADMIQ